MKFVLIVTDKLSFGDSEFVLIVTDKLSFGDRNLPFAQPRVKVGPSILSGR